MNELNIHIRLKEARKVLGLNQLTIANDLNIKQKTVSEIENGKIMNIPNTYIYYFRKKGISLEWIYSGKKEMFYSDNPKIEDNINKTNRTKTNDEHKLDNFNKLKTEIAQSNNSSELSNVSLAKLIQSKDFNIKTLLDQINSQEKFIAFLEEIIRKELKL